MVKGKAAFRATGHDWDLLCERMDVFERSPPHSLYIPNIHDRMAEAVTDCTVPM